MCKIVIVWTLVNLRRVLTRGRLAYVVSRSYAIIIYNYKYKYKYYILEKGFMATTFSSRYADCKGKRTIADSDKHSFWLFLYSSHEDNKS